MARLSRRALIGGGAAVAAVGGVAGVVGLRSVSSPEDTIARFIRSSVPGLAVPEADLHSFAATFLQRASWKGAKLKSGLLVLDHPGLLSLMPAVEAADYDWFRRRIISVFLFSTDFFSDAQRKGEQTHFLAYADPYGVGCRNPLASSVTIA